MKEDFTLLNNEIIHDVKIESEGIESFQPQKETLQKILQFASVYRAEKTHNDVCVGIILN